jgi:hypothetical protein
MHVERFYPWKTPFWAVWDGSSTPHSLWRSRADAQEMASRLTATLDHRQGVYTPFNPEPDSSSHLLPSSFRYEIQEPTP